MERLKGMLEENYRMAGTVNAITRPGDLEHTINRFDRGKLQVICSFNSPKPIIFTP